MKNPHQVTKDFEEALCEYTGSRYAVAVNSCTAALFLSLVWCGAKGKTVRIPKKTYCSVPMQVIHAGGKVEFIDQDWSGGYSLYPFPIYDFARRFTSGMFIHGSYCCVSFHWSKILGVQQGGAILHDNPDADAWFRRARFDGRAEGQEPKKDCFTLGWHCYMSPEVAAEGLMRLSILPKVNPDLPNSDYPDLSIQPVFKVKDALQREDDAEVQKKLELIDQISSIRSKNNGNWMDVLRLAFKANPREACSIMERICSTDDEISALAKELAK